VLNASYGVFPPPKWESTCTVRVNNLHGEVQIESRETLFSGEHSQEWPVLRSAPVIHPKCGFLRRPSPSPKVNPNDEMSGGTEAK
jgi:hypothetical protein